ncbi:MAG: RES family NAD+ phosphorylase [Bacteroidota bacterium]
MVGKIVLCSNCFTDEGLRLDSLKIGFSSDEICPNCGSNDGQKLRADLVEKLTHQFFVRGTLQTDGYGAAPLIQFNQQQKGDQLDLTDALQKDVQLIQKSTGTGLFYYGPRMWMLGEVEPLELLQSKLDRQAIIDRIVSEYPVRLFSKNETFYRLRKNPHNPESELEYDSPPQEYAGNGRLDSADLPILYGSQDLEICVHECRVSVEDELYIASLYPTEDLRLLDLTELIEENCTEFESLDIAIHMLFYAGSHSYEIIREIALQIKNAGFDGVIYPSYFSTMRTGAMPFDTVYGISIRKLPLYSDYAKSQIISNLALFDRPIKQGKIKVKCINKLFLKKVQYEVHFGPVRC